MLTKNEKIKALVDGTALELMAKNNAGETSAAFWEGITLDEIKKYVDENGISKNAYYHEPGTADGIYVLEIRGGWSVYSQERGMKFEEYTYTDKKDAIDKLVELMAAQFITAFR